jgi:glycosyltransferase involved in cell wall biosynthesis
MVKKAQHFIKFKVVGDCGGKALAIKKPLVSIITVVFNGAATIGDTIRSVVTQSYTNIEYIVIDGGSIDGTIDILNEHNNDIDYWVSEKDAGLYDAMNKGIAQATGDYIGMLNADDFFSDNRAVEKLVAHFETNSVDAVFACVDIVDPINVSRVLRKYRVASFSKFMLRIGVMPAHPTFYCKRECYEIAGKYRTDYRIAADFEMLTRMLLKHHITWSFMNEVLVKMRAGGMSSSGFKSSLRVNREIVRACVENGLYTNFLILSIKLPIRLWERFF